MNAGLSNLDTLKRHLLAPSQAASEVGFDQVIMTLGLGLAARIEKICNRKLMRQTGIQEIQPADRANFLLSRYPVEQVSLIELKLTESAGWVAQDATFYNTIDLQNGMVLLPEGADAGPFYAQIRFTYDGGFWWEQQEPGDPGYPGTQPATSNTLPADLQFAWLLQCQHVWESRDKLGLGLIDKPNEQSRMSELKLVPMAHEIIQPFIRYQMT